MTTPTQPTPAPGRRYFSVSAADFAKVMRGEAAFDVGQLPADAKIGWIQDCPDRHVCVVSSVAFPPIPKGIPSPTPTPLRVLDLKREGPVPRMTRAEWNRRHTMTEEEKARNIAWLMWLPIGPASQQVTEEEWRKHAESPTSERIQYRWIPEDAPMIRSHNNTPNLFMPLAPDEADRAFDEAPEVPLTEDEIASIVKYATSRGASFAPPSEPPPPAEEPSFEGERRS